MRKNRRNRNSEDSGGRAAAKGRLEPYIRSGFHNPEDEGLGTPKNGSQQAMSSAFPNGAVGGRRPEVQAQRRAVAPASLRQSPAKELKGEGASAINDGVVQPRKKLLSASGLIEATVRDLYGKRLGEIEDFILDLPTGEIEYVVFSFGGLFGLGNKLCAVSPQMLELDEEEKCFRLGYDKERVGNAPEFDKYHWQYLSRAAHRSRIYILGNTKRKAMKQDHPHHMYTFKR
ncbi:MAG: PRC-barrel domain-containing protein [Gammaproteobacteria bacterium]